LPAKGRRLSQAGASATSNDRTDRRIADAPDVGIPAIERITAMLGKGSRLALA
jgi:hypothetical protein